MLGAPNDFLRKAQGEHVTRDRSKHTHEGKTRSFPDRERSRYVKFPWKQNFWITTNRSPANMA